MNGSLSVYATCLRVSGNVLHDLYPVVKMCLLSIKFL